ncbi:hypothetical protein ACFL1R_05310 [Candidatus Latescibacterota bacterium]
MDEDIRGKRVFFRSGADRHRGIPRWADGFVPEDRAGVERDPHIKYIECEHASRAGAKHSVRRFSESVREVDDSTAVDVVENSTVREGALLRAEVSDAVGGCEIRRGYGRNELCGLGRPDFLRPVGFDSRREQGVGA